eukprot:TRINITY_DN1273_c0_g1_i1.p1 TRINITY_DN1273_c0_g1~~TRINITY_DN1273_c0_g1_i1.p1  ORF type:complete len:354 (-),score=104.73 TRINITY_DN1273_c0_g1_i1:89-1150(-)
MVKDEEVTNDEQLPEAKKSKKRALSIAGKDSLLKSPQKSENILESLSTNGHPLNDSKLNSSLLLSPGGGSHAEQEWPYELVLVRHGQSEGNEAVSRSKMGDLSAYTHDFQKKHSSSYRLTDKGIAQAKVTGEYLRKKIGDHFDRYYTSEYVRAMETAALLGLPNANWLTEITLRERDKGQLDNVSWIERNDKFADEMKRRKRDAFFWAPPGGESLAQICQRIDHSLSTLRRDCSRKRVIIVCHGEIMWGFRVRLERLSQIRFHHLQNSEDPKDKIHNTQILHYTRIHPETGEESPVFKWMRSICPWKPDNGSEEWMEFERPTYTNEDLMNSVLTVPRYVNNTKNPENDEEVDY